MIYFSGDLHGGASSFYVSSHKFKPAKRSDIVICCGDLGGVWWHDYHTNELHRREENRFLDTTLRKRVLWLTIDGNHENFGRLFGGEFPLIELFGGRAYKVRENIYYLKRGDIFTIEGQTFFAFGGALSQDKIPIRVPSLSRGTGYDITPGRTEGIDWWPEEIPSKHDLNNAYANLDKIGWQVNHVITHTCPASLRLHFQQSPRLPDPVENMLQQIYEKLTFKTWHFGHFHVNKRFGKFYCHYGHVMPLADVVMKDAVCASSEE